ncbi:hypothetical protein [Carboxylicivirga sp. M1479]|uniref:hypothetical protein n=1 Tax=Carboxylicivirga sp. M1479 TaxID=2594476 RepID=UPI001177B0DB|nr:hypothetical protein [Carboxylicivirga sp. M1479]TRX72608.1 hypothetical protein FNN09_01325 [Carboxylicivirga sp. M1479]
MQKTIITFLLLVFYISTSAAQEVMHHISNKAIYDFIDELANKGIIEINSTIKPYSRLTIAKALQQANGHASLTKRQQKELAFYLKDFSKELTIGKDFDKRFDVFYYSDSLFKVTVNPILGGQFFHNGDDLVYHRWGGAEFYGSIGKNVGIYGSLRDNHESQFLGGSEYISKRPGAVYKGDYDDKDYSETRGGITYSWKWGSLGLHKDHVVWGSGYSDAIILSGLAPSYGYISFKMNPVKWLEFNYMHGWLVSEVIDSSRTYPVYGNDRNVYANKFISANMFTIKPMKKLNISFGNSIIVGDTDFNPTFMVPFLFYKSADHTYNSWDNWVGHNAQMYLDVSSRQIKNLHLYMSLFIDEISLERMFDEELQSNHLAIKFGAKVNDLLPDVSLTAEYTRVRPMTYDNFVPSITFRSNDFMLGSYMRDNAEELYLAIGYKPIRGLDLQATYTSMRRGKDYMQILNDGEIDEHPEINPDEERWGLPFINEERYSNQSITFKASYQIINDGFIFVEATNNSFGGPDKDLYTNPYYLKGDNIFSFGMNFGF